MAMPATFNDPLASFTAHLRTAGLRMTPQRLRIMQAFLYEEGHRSAEDMLSRVRQDDPSIGQATIYRTMKLLCEAGLAREVHLGDGAARYEHLHANHHDHLICERCGTTIEVVDPDIERLQDALAHKHGFTPTTHRLTLYGICPACQRRKPSHAPKT